MQLKPAVLNYSQRLNNNVKRFPGTYENVILILLFLALPVLSRGQMILLKSRIFSRITVSFFST